MSSSTFDTLKIKNLAKRGYKTPKSVKENAVKKWIFFEPITPNFLVYMTFIL